MSSTGVSGKASMLSISITLPFTDMILHRVMAIKLGRTGECVANTPVKASQSIGFPSFQHHGLGV